MCKALCSSPAQRAGMDAIKEATCWRESALAAGLYPSTGTEMKIVSHVKTERPERVKRAFRFGSIMAATGRL